MTINTNISNRAAALKAEALDNSSLFDVHVWASDEAKEVNDAVHITYQQLVTDCNFKGQFKVRRKHVKTLLLDLYIKWLTDPKKYVSIYLRHEYYDRLEVVITNFIFLVQLLSLFMLFVKVVILNL